MGKSRRWFSALLAAAALCALTAASAQALESARRGLALCAGVIIPSLLPFFAVSTLIGELGLPSLLGRAAAPVMSRLFNLPGEGAAAFILGVTGGYPLGAAAVADLVSRGRADRDQGERLLAFCNNTGPAFTVGAAGVGVFGSAGTGLMLYASHVLAALTAGLLMSPGRGGEAPLPPPCAWDPPPLDRALVSAVRSSVASVLTVCGFVVFFTVCVGLLDAAGIFTRLSGELAVATGAGLGFSRALLTGLMELGSGVGALAGLPPSPANLALCSFILGWGGVSVHFQTAAAVAGAGIKTARHTVGRLLCGIISAIYTLALAAFF